MYHTSEIPAVRHTSLKHRWWKNGVKGSAKCCGAVCSHKIIELQDLRKGMKVTDWGLGLYFTLLNCDISLV